MRVKIGEVVKNTGRRLVSGIKRYPEPLLLAAVSVAIGIYLNHSGLASEIRDLLDRVIMTAALGVPLFLCIRTCFERFPDMGKALRITIWAAGILALPLYYRFFLQDIHLVPVGRYIGISLALYLGFTFLPYFLRRPGYELHVIKLLSGFVITYLYSMVLYLGLAAILFTIDRLFSAGLPSKIYFDMFLIVAGVFAPGYFLSGVPKQNVELSAANYPGILRVLLSGIVMPLTVAYAAILYAYFIKILLTGDWPSGLVSNLVLWFSIITASVVFLIYVLRNTLKWAAFYTRWMPIFLLPLLVMLFVSIGIRIKAYGITENRYFVVLAGLWVTGCMFYHIFICRIFRRTASNIVMTVSLAVIAILAVTGPWSGFSISKLSQNARFENILERNGMLVGSSIREPSSPLNTRDKNDLAGILEYFNRYHSLKEVRYLPPDFNFDKTQSLFGFSMGEIGPGNGGTTEYFSHYVSDDSLLYHITGYDYFLQFQYYKQSKISSEQGGPEFQFDPASREVRITRGGQSIYSAKPEEIAAQIHRDNKGISQLKPEAMRFSEENNDVKVLYVFKSINGTENSATGEIEASMPEFYLFVKIK